MGQRGSLDLVLIQRLRVIVDARQLRRERNLARPVRGAGGSPGYGRGSARRANDEVDHGGPPRTANLLVPVASPGAAPIGGSVLLRQRQAPVKFRRGGARLALRMVWHDQ